MRVLIKALDVAAQCDEGSARDVLTARIWISIASSESELNGLQRGLVALAEAEQYAARSHDLGLQVMLHLQLGYMRLQGGQVTQSLHDLDRAVALIEHAEPRDAYSILLNRGTTHLFLGDLSSARKDLHRAERGELDSATRVKRL
jgi:hypothetical protein